MAKPNFAKLKEVYIDGVPTIVSEKARIIDVVDSDVAAVEAFNPNVGKMELLTRDRFNQNLPEGITTHLTHIEKGGHDDWENMGDGWHINKRSNGWLVWHENWGGDKNHNHYHILDDGRSVHKPTRQELNKLKSELRR